MENAKATHGKPRLNYPRTILASFGFLASMVGWTIYNPYITKILNRLLSESPLVAQWSSKLADIEILRRFTETQAAFSSTSASLAGTFTLVPLLIGFIMTFDNIFGVIFQPLFGRLSDNCHSRFGKRRPFIMICAPISALLFVLIPRMNTLPAVMVVVILFVFFMSIWRSPAVALTPDITPPELHSSGNAVVNLVGTGGGAILGQAAGLIVTAIYVAVTKIPKDNLDEIDIFPYIFLFGAVFMIIGTLVVTFFVKEPDSRLLSTDTLALRDENERKAAEKKAREEEKAARKAMTLSRGEKTSLGFMLACLFFQFAATDSVQTFFALFADEILHKSTADAMGLTIMLAVSAGAAALPAGWLGRKIGRKKTILLGMGLFMSAFAVFFVALMATTRGLGISVNDYIGLNKGLLQAAKEAGLNVGSFISQNPLFAGAAEITAILNMVNTLIFPVLGLAGFGTMMVTVNTLPLVLQIGGIKRIGTFTGIYYTATFSAQIVAPLAFGTLAMFSGTYFSLFYFSPIMLVLSLAMILFVKHGEAVPQEVIEQAEQAA